MKASNFKGQRRCYVSSCKLSFTHQKSQACISCCSVSFDQVSLSLTAPNALELVDVGQLTFTNSSLRLLEVTTGILIGHFKNIF
jgi:hypothetical protein